MVAESGIESTGLVGSLELMSSEADLLPDVEEYSTSSTVQLDAAGIVIG
jgi:hypothetical protein